MKNIQQKFYLTFYYETFLLIGKDNPIANYGS